MEPKSAILARLAYLIVLLVATLSGVELDPDAGRVGMRLSRVLDPELRPVDAVDGARNIVLFAGWGLVWVLTAPVGRALGAVAAATASGALISLSVELVQLLSATRTPSVLDLGTNTGGALLGALAVVAVHRLIVGRRGSRSYLGLPAWVMAGPYAAAVLGEALIPLFRKTPVPGADGGPLDRMAVTAAAFDWSSLFDWPWLDLPLFLPAGLLGVVALAEEGVPYRRAAAWTAVAGFVAMMIMELGHGVIGLPMVAGAVLLHGVAIALGAVLAVRVVPPFTRRWRGRRRVAWVAVAYAAVVLLWILRPYLPETDPGAMIVALTSGWWTPLRFLAFRLDLYSVMDVITSFFLYAPVGALLAVWPVRRSGALRAFLPGLYLAVAAESLQLLVAARTLDITDMLINAAGVVVGWALVRRGGLGERGALDPPSPES